jgi:hypothetical protein
MEIWGYMKHRNKSKSSLTASNQKEELEKARRKHEKFMGIFLAAVSGLFFTLCSVMVKLLKRIDPSEVLVMRHRDLRLFLKTFYFSQVHTIKDNAY